jgi:phosphatidylglycerol---prolipoprotein diacylglyceryl transferase
MFPVIFEIGPLKIHSFGLMVMMAFLVGGWMVTKELRRRGIVPDHLEGYPILALVGGIVGARAYYLFEHAGDLQANFFGTLFGGAGLTWYGGVVGGALAVLVWAHRKGQSKLAMCDAFAPGLAAAYGVGRIGCQLAGDGDYGPPSDAPWAMAYPKGVVPTIVAVHPTPVYEILMMIPVVAILWHMRTRMPDPGRLFGLYMVLVGAERWIAEIYRVRPEKTMGMSTAQWISVAAILVGVMMIVTLSRRSENDA